MANYFIGVDIGTAGTKAALVDLNGNIIASAYEESKLYYPRVGWVEQEPEDFYMSAVNTIREVIRKSGVDPQDVASIAFSGQMAGILAIDKNWKPVMPYDSWLDIRCKDYIDYLKVNYEEFLIEKTGVPPTVNHLPKMIWWKRERPEVFEKIYKFTVPGIYAAGKFAGLNGDEAYYDYTYASFTGMYDVYKLTWSEEISETFDIPVDKLPRLVKPWEVIGELTSETAQKSGLRKGIPVVAGAGDYIASCFGAGLTQVGQCVDVAGTASIFSISIDKVIPDKRYKTLLYVKAIPPELWQVGAYINGGGLCLRWFRDEIGRYEKKLGEEIGKDAYKILDEKAAQVPIGSEGLIFIPHLGGRAYPYTPSIKGIWFGFTWKHTIGHLFRSVMEGIAYEYYFYCNIAKSIFKDLRFSEVRGIGGGSRSEVWRQIKSDVLNMPYVILNKEEYAVLALAAIGGYGVNVIKDYIAIINEWVKPVKRVEPIRENAEKYANYAQFYQELLTSVEGIFSKHLTLLA
ncbi:MAG: FGGY family carbohydrate kinase [Aigarchaeota archaeon]|nr:FGGY family carbohydrate kinase [Aigarchaeota archaeon]